MAATVLAQHGHTVTVFEKRTAPAFKFLLAGKSGLNITNSTNPAEFHNHYRNHETHFKTILQSFGPNDWINFVEKLGIKTFVGSSHRVFVEGLKAGKLLNVWMKELKKLNVKFVYQSELTNWETSNNEVKLTFNHTTTHHFDAAILSLGGASYYGTHKPSWMRIFESKKIPVISMSAANVGVEIDWPQKFFNECDGQFLKNITVTTDKHKWQGELFITRYGLEGTPIYNLRDEIEFCLDLKPDLTEIEIEKKVLRITENLSPLRKLKKAITLSDTAQALLFHCLPKTETNDLQRLIHNMKNFPVHIKAYRPLDEAISSRGGVVLSAVNENLMLKAHPGIYVCGEMLDWDAPTGGFLIQACVSQGHFAASCLASVLDSK